MGFLVCWLEPIRRFSQVHQEPVEAPCKGIHIEAGSPLIRWAMCQAFKVGRCWQLLKAHQADPVQELVGCQWLIPAEEHFFPMLASEQPVSSSGVAGQLTMPAPRKTSGPAGLTLALCKPGIM